MLCTATSQDVQQLVVQCARRLGCNFTPAAFCQLRKEVGQFLPCEGKSQKKCNARNLSKINSIAFGSAPRREADSQPISQLVRQAVSQTVSRASRQADRNKMMYSKWGYEGSSGNEPNSLKVQTSTIATRPGEAEFRFRFFKDPTCR